MHFKVRLETCYTRFNSVIPTLCPQSRGLQKLSIKAQVLNTNLVAMCMSYGDTYPRYLLRAMQAPRFSAGW
jgi:hypothetical protein